MVFSSTVFLFLFLPLFLAVYLLTPRAGKNLVLLLASAFFYFWGEVWLLALMLGSATLDYVCGRLMVRDVGSEQLDPKAARSALQKFALTLSIAGNLGALAFFKYFDFGLESWSRLVERLGLDALAWQPTLEIALPLGISFYTFQSMSYTIDVYRGQVAATGRPIDFLCFVSMFPQLVAGPIVRYREVETQLVDREITLDGFALGVRRFAIGLGKKVLIANMVAVPADAVFDLSPSALTAPVAWWGLACYTLQIYFDFSGYSDMAIGLGRMLGFQLPENFDHPYVARSVREFWRRWHMTLSLWFRDYLYIPLGGGRGGATATYRNLLIVFLLCGLWHGAAWNFAVWGLFHGFFLVAERQLASRSGRRLAAWMAHVYTMGVVMSGWVFFRADSLGHALGYLRALVGFNAPDLVLHPLVHFVDPRVVAVAALGAVMSMPIASRFGAIAVAARPVLGALVRTAAVAFLLVASAMALAAGTHNPFIYFRF